MGLTSALSTALTGMNGAETTIDVVGNNLANSNTVGFKSSSVSFATQFLQTLSLGGAPTSDSGGTNPMQVGLGTTVAQITPDFSQGTVSNSSNPYDMAIQGDGFFIVQGGAGEVLYTRNGEFKLNSENELTTTTGNRVLGYGVDDNFQIQKTTLEPLSIPLGSAAVAQATQNAYLEGTLTPTGDVADTGSIIHTNILGRDDYDYPTTAVTTNNCDRPNFTSEGTTFTVNTTAGNLMTGDTVIYRVVYGLDQATTAGGVAESNWAEYQITATADHSSIDIANIPHNPGTIGGDPSPYQYVRIYRKDSHDANYHLIDDRDLTDPGPWTLNDPTVVGGYSADPNLTTTLMTGEYTYYVTFGKVTDPSSVNDPELNSRPSPLTTSPIRVTDNRVVLTDLPSIDADNPDLWNCRRIWRRNNTSDDSSWHLVAEVENTDQNVTVIDGMPDTGTGGAFAQPVLDLDGPRIGAQTRLVDVVRRDGQTYENVFQEGTLEFTGSKGGRTQAEKNLTITADTTVQELLNFMEQALGIQKSVGGSSNTDIPADAGTGDQPGGYIEDGRISLLGNTGTANALSIGLSGMLMKSASGTTNINMPWEQTQAAVGQSAVTEFVAYDSLGIPLNVRLTAVLESRDSTSTTYRWFADSSDNDPATGVKIAVGTGLIHFDGEGNFISASNSTVSIDRRHIASASPLEFNLDFNQISGLAANKSTLAVSRQDGSAAGVLTSFICGEDGVIRGVFSNGVTRDLGEFQLARFSNAAGLQQRGENLYSSGVNSGLPVIGDPGQSGIGKIVAGATELSNSDIGGDLVKLILASTMYRGNARVITTTQDMFDELMNLRR